MATLMPREQNNRSESNKDEGKHTHIMRRGQTGVRFFHMNESQTDCEGEKDENLRVCECVSPGVGCC